jgi:hypothetical protein
VPRFFGSVAVLVGTYVVAMIAAALWLPHEWDWAAFSPLRSRPPLDPAIMGSAKVCDASFFSAEFVLLNGSRRQAAQAFDAAQAQCADDDVTQSAAKAERKQLGASPP